MASRLGDAQRNGLQGDGREKGEDGAAGQQGRGGGKNKALEDGFYVLIVVGVIIIMGCGRYRKCLKSIYVSIYVSICKCASIRSQSAEATKFECQ